MSQFTKGLMAGVGMSLCVTTAAVANDLTVVSWGGAYTKSQVEAYHKPWMAATGTTVISEAYGGGIAVPCFSGSETLMCIDRLDH